MARMPEGWKPNKPKVKSRKRQPQLTKDTGKRIGDYATGGRVGKSSGGSIRARLSSGGPVGKPN